MDEEKRTVPSKNPFSKSDIIWLHGQIVAELKKRFRAEGRVFEHGEHHGEGGQEPIEKAAVIIKGWDGAAMTIGGYGAVWGGKDIDGDYFSPATDFWFDRINPHPMVLYDHGRDDAVKKVVVGHVNAKAPDDVGLWIEAQLDRATEYAEAITELVESGKLGWSSGAVSHLVEREEDGFLRSWPTVEFSLTPTPCEPRTLGVQALRSLAEADPAVKAVLPEGDVVSQGTEASGATVTEGPDKARIGRAKAQVEDVNLYLEEME